MLAVACMPVSVRETSTAVPAGVGMLRVELVDGLGEAMAAGDGPVLDDGRIKHLELIQMVVARMGNNSFLIKGWSLTVTGALLDVMTLFGILPLKV